MTYRGRVKDGAVVLDELIPLPDGAEVLIEPVAEECPTLYEQLKDVIGIASDLPVDMAENHDHYIHGLPKRS